ncbi:uncharacterized protein [Antedon mediterranea]|uniref:uncharacterized protein n=1 Tax=Antedon mediterranea TaxID=105859 RepID=UPI003AF8E24F
MEFHERALSSLCYCCGKKFKIKDVKYTYEYNLDPNLKWLCGSCHVSALGGHNITPFNFKDHGDKCLACYLFSQQSRPGRRLKKCKFPENRSNTTGSFIPTHEHLLLNPQFKIFENYDNQVYECQICNNLLSIDSQQTPCQHFFCTFCINKLFKAVGRESIDCFNCSQIVSNKDLKPVPLIVEQSLKRVLLQCKQCKIQLVWSETPNHVCKTFKEQAFTKILSAVEEITCTAQTNEVWPKELKSMAHNIVRKDLMNNKKVSLMTRGRPINIVKQSECTTTVSVTSTEEKMDPQRCLAIMNACRINWSQQRALRRFCPGVLASERQMRICQEQIIGDHIVDSMEYMFVKRDGATSIGGLVLEEVAVVRLTKIKELIYDYLNKYDMSDELNFFKDGDIFLKFGGDKGGDTTKFEVQICSLPKPNALHNIIVILAFQAPDFIVNVEKGLKLVLDEVMDLDGNQWTSPKTKK